jgi:hypothetical protein
MTARTREKALPSQEEAIEWNERQAESIEKRRKRKSDRGEEKK